MCLIKSDREPRPSLLSLQKYNDFVYVKLQLISLPQSAKLYNMQDFVPKRCS